MIADRYFCAPFEALFQLGISRSSINSFGKHAVDLNQRPSVHQSIGEPSYYYTPTSFSDINIVCSREYEIIP